MIPLAVAFEIRKDLQWTEKQIESFKCQNTEQKKYSKVIVSREKENIRKIVQKENERERERKNLARLISFFFFQSCLIVACDF